MSIACYDAELQLSEVEFEDLREPGFVKSDNGHVSCSSDGASNTSLGGIQLCNYFWNETCSNIYRTLIFL